MLVIQSTDAKNKGSLLLLSVTNKGSFLVLVIQSADAKNKGSFLMLAVTPRIKHQRGTSGSLLEASQRVSHIFAPSVNEILDSLNLRL